MHSVNGPRSSEQSNRVTGSFAVNANVASLAVVGSAGPEVIVTTGGPVRVQLYTAGLASTLPSGSTARTWNSCDPKVTSSYSRGEVQAVKTAPSSEHWKVVSGSLLVKVKSASSSGVWLAGPAVTVVSGGTPGGGSSMTQR